MNSAPASAPTVESQLTPSITVTLALCLAVAMAPWLTGGQEPVALVVSGGALLLGALLALGQPAVRALKVGPLGVTYTALLAWGALSLLWTANRYSTTLWLVVMVLAGVAFRLSTVVAAQPGGRLMLARLYVGSAVVFAVYGLWLYLTNDYGRLTGSFYWANPAAGYLIPALLISLDQLRTRGRSKWLWLAVTVLLGGAFVLTDSRAATLVLALAVALYLMVQRLNRRDVGMVVLALLSAFLLSQICVQTKHITRPNAQVVAPGSRFADAANGESSSGSDRLVYIKSGLVMWFSQPLLGVGAGAYGDVHPRFQERVVSASTSAHNFYVQTLAELGIVGAILLAWVLLALLVGWLRGGLESPVLAGAIIVGLAGLLLHIGLDIDARYPAIVLLVAVLGGAMYGQRRRVGRRLAWYWPVVAAAVMVPVVLLYQSSAWAQRGLAAQTDTDYALAADNFSRAAGPGGAVGWYNPDVLTAAGINDLAQAVAANGPAQKSRLGDALALARAAEAADPADGQHHQLEGRVLAAQGDLADSEQALRRALELDPYNHPEYAYDLAQVQQQRGHTHEAVATAQAMLAQYPDAVIDNRNADATLRPLLANLWAFVGNRALEAGDWPTAAQAAGRAVSTYPGSLRGRALKVQVRKLAPVSPPPS